MNVRFVIALSALFLATAMIVPVAQAAESAPPVPLAAGEEVVSHSTTSHSDSQYVIDLLASIKGVKITADKATLFVDNHGTTHPIEVDYGSALSGRAQSTESDSLASEPGAAGGPGTTGSSASGGLGIGQIAGMLLGLTILSRVIGIIRQLGGGRR